MESTVSSSNKFALQSGLLFGVLIIVLFVAMYVLGLDPSQNTVLGVISGFLNYLIFPVLCISLAIISTRNKLQGGFISYGQCIKIGVIVAALAGLIYAVFYIVFNMVVPEFIEEMMANVENAMRAKSPEMPEEQLETALSIGRKFSSPYIAGPIGILWYTFVGLIETLIIGAILKKDRQ